MTNDRSFVAMVLAGGLGTRLSTVVADRCKPMALVEGEPFLARVLDQLAAAGCRRAILCTGHHGEQIEQELGREHGGMELAYSRETTPQGTGGALRLALPLLGEADGVLVLNGDSYVDCDLQPFVARARLRSTPASLIGVPVPDAARYGCLTIDAAGLVRQFREKSPGIGPAVISAGIYWFERCLLASSTATFPCSLERDVLPTLLDGRLAADQVEAAFLDIGLPEAYASAAQFFAQCQHRKRRDRKGLLVVDRDGTLIAERHYLADPRQVELLPGVVDGLRAFAAHGYDLAIVTNQSGIGRGYFDETTLTAIHTELRRQLGLAGITIQGIWHCPHRPDEGCECRKPSPQMLDRAMQELGYTPDQCLVVGDKACDIELGGRLGVRTALVRTGYGAGTERDGLCTPDVIVDGLRELALQEVGP